MALQFDTYDQLVASIADELMRSDLTDQIPGAIRLAEAEIRADVEVVTQIRRAYISGPAPATGANEVFENLPRQCLRIESVVVIDFSVDPNKRTPLIPKTKQEIDMLWLDPRVGTPTCYARVGDQIYFDSKPENERIEITYARGFTHLADEEEGTNRLLQDAPNLYFYGALAHLAPYLREDERLPVWRDFYDRAKTALNRQAKRMKYAGPMPSPAPMGGPF